MKYIKDTLDFRIEEPSVITLGKFDGLHTGHRYLMEAMQKGKSHGLKCVIFTFDIPPKAIHKDKYSVLSTNEEKAHIFAEAGVDYLIECPFTDDFRQLSPYDFLQILKEKINVKMIVAGTDFHFGYQRSGSYRELQQYAADLGYEAVIVTKKQYKGKDISSTRIRACIAEGDMEEANYLLGYSYFLTGTVLHGNEIGRTIGIPTANQRPEEFKLLPPKGVYAVEVLAEGMVYDGISNIGCKPTIEGVNPMGVETFLFDYSGNLYGKDIKVSFLKFIRPERKFASLAELKTQIDRDIMICKEYLAKVHSSDID